VLVADINLDGLAICCFNPTEKVWEIAVPRYEDHDFTIYIQEKNLEGPLGIPCQFRIDGARRIEFTVENGSNSQYAQYPQGYVTIAKEFDRNAAPSFDFRWTVDCAGAEVEHGEFRGLKRRRDHPQRVDVTLIRVPHSLFYTKEVTAAPVVMAPINSRDACEGGLFGRTNSKVGGAVLGSGIPKLTIVNPENPNSEISLDYKLGHWYEIEITNMDKDKSGDEGEEALLAPAAKKPKIKDYKKGDFHRYYDVLDVAGEKQSLWAPAKGNDKGGLGRLSDCHSVWVSGVETLSPLLD
jgi:hypothetical protein